VVAAPEVIAQLTQAKQGTDLHTSTLDQMIAYEMLGSGYLEDHQQLIVRTYHERRDVMLALAEHSPEARWTRPEGGMFLWVELPDAIDASELLREAMKQQVAFVPGQGFHVDGSGHNTLRLNFSNSTSAQIRGNCPARALELVQGGLEEGRNMEYSFEPRCNKARVGINSACSLSIVSKEGARS
jgi:2-aminoadipate transaminase